MNELEFYKRLATEKSTDILMVKLPPVLKEFVAEQPNMSEYVKNLIIADYEQQLTPAPADTAVNGKGW
jgi:hypothetical protein